MKIPVPSFVIVVTTIAWLAGPSSSGLAARASHANGESGNTADISMFYDALKLYGAWYNTNEYGDVWHPTISDQKPDWRPYTNGSWAQTDQGWTWVTDEPFGWAVYHYGRWTQLKDTGWVWLPDSKWAPAWVAWRSTSNLQVADVSGPDQLSYHDANSAAATPAAAAPTEAAAGEPASTAPSSPPASDQSGTPPDAAGAPPAGSAVSMNYIGWAPLPPDADLPPDGDIGPSADATFAVLPDDYCFVNAVDFGDPDLSLVIFPRDRDYFFVAHTLNVTNITSYGPGGRSIYVGGPDFARVSALSRKPIPKLQIARETRSSMIARSLRDGQTSAVHGNTLQIVGPRFKNRPPGGTLGGDRPALRKVDGVKAIAPAGADPTAVAQAHDAMARQAHETLGHAQAAHAVAASQAEYKGAGQPAHSLGGAATSAREVGGAKTSGEERTSTRSAEGGRHSEHSSRGLASGTERRASRGERETSGGEHLASGFGSGAGRRAGTSSRGQTAGRGYYAPSLQQTAMRQRGMPQQQAAQRSAPQPQGQQSSSTKKK